MADLLTSYEDDQANNFIDCTICNKRIRGETHYKIHLSTLQHWKKEDALAAVGQHPRPLPLPKWTDIKQYLEYLKLDEPIVGLSALVQEEDVIQDDGKVQLRYRCKMCPVETCDMSTMVSHVVSRKHRMKYLQLKRPELLTCQRITDNTQKQPGLVARAKAAILEKKEGWGTPVPLNRPSWDKELEKRTDNRHGMTEGYHSYACESSYSSQNRRRRSPTAKDNYKRSDDAYRRPSYYREDDLYDRSSRDNAARLKSSPEDERHKMTYYQDNRKRHYQDGHNERLKGDFSVRSLREDDDCGRRSTDRVTPRRSRRDEHQDEYYTEVNPRRGRNSSRDVRDVSRNRFTDIELTGSAQHPEEIDYQDDLEIEDQSYTLHEGRRRTMGERQYPGRSFWYTEKEREHLRNLERTSGSFEVQGYTQKYRDGMRDHAPKSPPVKRKKKSRFSDATPLEMAVTQTRFIESIVLKKKPGGPVSSSAQVSKNRLESDVMHSSQNVLNMLNDIKIENIEEANFIKEKLCNLVKEFHANKAQHAETQVTRCIKDYHHGNDQSRHIQEARHLVDQGFQENTRYENDRDFQEGRYFKASRSIRDVREYEQDSYKEWVRSNKREGYPTDFQKARRFENNVRDFQNEGYFGEDSTDFPNERGFGNNSRDFQHEDHVQHDTCFEEDPRISENRHTWSTEEHEGYEEYATVEGRYCESDSTPSQSCLSTRYEYERDPKRRGSPEQSEDFKDYQTNYDRRTYQESQWKSNSKREEETVYGESQAERTRYQHDYTSSTECYDPFHPSSSPPREAAPPPSSLEKLASTLLQLVSRKK